MVSQLFCQPLKRGYYFSFGTFLFPALSDAFRVETKRRQLLQTSRPGFEEKIKHDPVEHNSRRATVKGKQTEHMAPLWC